MTFDSDAAPTGSYDQVMRGDKPFPRIVVPTDGSQLSQSAAHAAAALARRAGVPLTLFGVTYSEDDRDDLANALNELITTLRRDLVVDVIVDVIGAAVTVEAYVAEAILDEADVDGALVCIASHGHRGLGVALLGSITEEVIGKSPTPGTRRRTEVRASAMASGRHDRGQRRRLAVLRASGSSRRGVVGDVRRAVVVGPGRCSVQRSRCLRWRHAAMSASSLT